MVCTYWKNVQIFHTGQGRSKYLQKKGAGYGSDQEIYIKQESCYLPLFFCQILEKRISKPGTNPDVSLTVKCIY